MKPLASPKLLGLGLLVGGCLMTYRRVQERMAVTVITIAPHLLISSGNRRSPHRRPGVASAKLTLVQPIADELPQLTAQAEQITRSAAPTAMPRSSTSTRRGRKRRPVATRRAVALRFEEVVEPWHRKRYPVTARRDQLVRRADRRFARQQSRQLATAAL